MPGYDPPYDISHLWVGDQTRIRQGVLNAEELAALSRGENPWGKSEPQQNDLPLQTGTRVAGQMASETNEERQQREQQEIETEVVGSMPKSHQETYNNPDTPQDQRDYLFQIYKDRLDQKKEREAAEFRKRADQIANAQELLQRIESDPSKADLPRPGDDSEETLLKWYDEMSKVKRRVPFAGSADGGKGNQWINSRSLNAFTKEDRRRERIENAIRAGRNPDPEDIAEEEAEAERYQRNLAEARKKRRKELEVEFTSSAQQTPMAPIQAEQPERREPKDAVIKIAPTSIQDKLWKLAESNFFMGGGVAMAIAGYGFILANAPRFGFWLLILAWLIMSVSVWRHRFFERQTAVSQIMRNMAVCGLIGIILFVIWILLT